MNNRLAVILILLAAGQAGCQTNDHYNPQLRHHTPEGFRNNHNHGPRPSFWKWRWERFWNSPEADPEGGYGFQVLKADTAFLAANRTEATLTWIGHATLLLQLGGVNILTDPHLTARASPVDFAGPERTVPPALDFADLPHIDVVLVSHDHYDHLDLETLERLGRQPGGPPTVFVPLGLGDWLARQGIAKVVQQDWWQSTVHLGLRIHQVPSQHFSARSPFIRDDVLWGGFVVEHPDFRFYFAGDTGYSPDFAEIGRRLGPIDLAALPIGAYAPRWFMKTMHINPAEAVRAHQDLKARYSVGMHWGTFRMTDERLDEPPKKLAAAREEAGIPAHRFFLLQHGETRRLTPLLRPKTGANSQSSR